MYDFKKEYKEQYQPKVNPSIIDVPSMNYLQVQGKGNPGEENSEYMQSIELLYGVAYTLKMSYKSDYKIKGFYQYVVPPLEGYWWQTGINGYDKTRKDLFEFISMIRLPDFISKEDVDWAIEVISNKKKKDYSKVKFNTVCQGLCVQSLHIGPYDLEHNTTAIMDAYCVEQGYQLDFSDVRHHHEIYISDPRRVDVSKLKTILRHPIKKEGK